MVKENIFKHLQKLIIQIPCMYYGDPVVKAWLLSNKASGDF